MVQVKKKTPSFRPASFDTVIPEVAWLLSGGRCENRACFPATSGLQNAQHEGQNTLFHTDRITYRTLEEAGKALQMTGPVSTEPLHWQKKHLRIKIRNVNGDESQWCIW